VHSLGLILRCDPTAGLPSGGPDPDPPGSGTPGPAIAGWGAGGPQGFVKLGDWRSFKSGPSRQPGAQALRHVPDAATWQPASQRSITWVNRPSEAGSALVSGSFHPSQTLHRRLIALAVLFKPAPFDHLPRQCHRAYRLTAAEVVEAVSALEQVAVGARQPKRLDHPRKQCDRPVCHCQAEHVG
jgi:hypothetical protein